MDIKNYQIVKKIGEGGFGTVYKAKDTSSLSFAIKKLKTDKKSENLSENEIAILESLHFPSIVETKEIIRTPCYIYIVSEYCPGGDLESLIESSCPLPMKSIKRWIKNLIQACQYLKDQRIIHRDLKPANILLTSKSLEEADVKLCDFGFSKHLGNYSLAKTRLGTPLYMAPEIFLGKNYDYKVDIWSLGVLAFELIYRKSPFKCRTMVDLMKALNKPIVFPDDPQVPQSAIDLIRSMCQIDPQDRPSYKDLLKSEFLLESDYLNASHESNFSLLKMSIESKLENEEHLPSLKDDEIPANDKVEILNSGSFEVSDYSNQAEMTVPKHSIKPSSQAESEEEKLVANIKIREIRLNDINDAVENLLKNTIFNYVFKQYILSNNLMIINLIENFSISFQEFQSSRVTTLLKVFKEQKSHLEIMISEEWQQDFADEPQLIRNLFNWMETGSFTKQELKAVSSIAYHLYPSDRNIYSFYLSCANLPPF